MKTLSTITTFLFLFSSLSFSQVDISFGFGKYMLDNSDIGINVGASFKNIYLDISSNLKGGSREVENNFGKSVKTENSFIFLINTGYNFSISKRLYILPEVGIGWISDIYLQ